MMLTSPPALVLREFDLVNGRLAMELTSNLALRSSASVISGNDIYGDDESASSNGACLHVRRPHLLSPLPSTLCCIVPVPRYTPVSRPGA